jgi:hypothetical protein
MDSSRRQLLQESLARRLKPYGQLRRTPSPRQKLSLAHDSVKNPNEEIVSQDITNEEADLHLGDRLKVGCQSHPGGGGALSVTEDRRKFADDIHVELAFEGDREISQVLQRHPSPGIEFRMFRCEIDVGFGNGAFLK